MSKKQEGGKSVEYTNGLLLLLNKQDVIKTNYS